MRIRRLSFYYFYYNQLSNTNINLSYCCSGEDVDMPFIYNVYQHGYKVNRIMQIITIIKIMLKHVQHVDRSGSLVPGMRHYIVEDSTKRRLTQTLSLDTYRWLGVSSTLDLITMYNIKLILSARQIILNFLVASMVYLFAC